MDIYKVINEPHITEKGSLQKELHNQITLEVHRKAKGDACENHEYERQGTTNGENRGEET